MKISIQTNPADMKGARERLKASMDAVKNTKTPLAQMAIVLYQSVMKNFQEEGTDKAKWKPLSPFTIMARRKGKGTGSAKILQDTGYMKASITPQVKEKEIEVGLSGQEASIGRKHQFGVPSQGRIPGIPKRPFMVLRADYQERIEKIARDWFFEKPSNKGVV